MESGFDNCEQVEYSCVSIGCVCPVSVKVNANTIRTKFTSLRIEVVLGTVRCIVTIMY